MLQKTREKLDRRLLSLPLHHIDTSVIIEPETTENGKACRKYLQKVSYNYRGVISLPVLGELFLRISLLKASDERHAALDVFTDLISARQIDFYTPKSIGNILSEMENSDKRIGPTDLTILACATEHRAQTLVTIDRKLLDSSEIQTKFKIRILHPKDLV